MLIELVIAHAIYKTKTVYEKHGGDEFPEEKQVLVKEIKIKKWFHVEAITSIEEYVGKNNRVVKSRCMIFDKYSSRFYVTWHPAGEILQMLQKPKQPIGFSNGNHFHTR